MWSSKACSSSSLHCLCDVCSKGKEPASTHFLTRPRLSRLLRPMLLLRLLLPTLLLWMLLLWLQLLSLPRPGPPTRGRERKKSAQNAESSSSSNEAIPAHTCVYVCVSVRASLCVSSLYPLSLSLLSSLSHMPVSAANTESLSNASSDCADVVLEPSDTHSNFSYTDIIMALLTVRRCVSVEDHHDLEADKASVAAASTASTTGPKPCLKRSNTNTKLGRGSSCDSLNGEEEDHSSTVSFGSSIGSNYSRKSVSFADSIGEELCRIKLFRKDVHEDDLDGYDEVWPMRLWRWQNFFGNNHHQAAAAGTGFEDFEDPRHHVDLNDISEEILGFESDEDEDEDEEEEARAVDDDDDDEAIYMRGKQNGTLIVPTFISPKDFPDKFERRLKDNGVCLESASVTDDGLVTGTIAVRVNDEDTVLKEDSVRVRYSFDGWKTLFEVATTSFKTGETYGFLVDAGRMEIGDDMEIVVVGPGLESLDDNSGLKYRFICKSRDKFQPGKSLW